MFGAERIGAPGAGTPITIDKVAGNPGAPFHCPISAHRVLGALEELAIGRTISYLGISDFIISRQN